MKKVNQSAGPAPRPEVKPPRLWNRSFTGGVIHGVFFAAHTALGEPNSVLPAFVTALSPARWLVGLVSAVLVGGQILEVVFAYYLQAVARRAPYFVGAVFTRATAWLVLGLVVAGWPGLSPGFILGLFFVLVTVYSIMGGLGGVALTDVVGGSIPAGARGRFYGLRQTLGSLVAFGSGYVVRLVLRPGFRPFPADYALLFLLSGLTLYVGVVGAALMQEEPRPRPARPPFSAYVARVRDLLSSHARLRSLLYMQLASGATLISVPFYIVYARQGLGLSPAVIGTVVAAQVAGAAISNIIWGLVRDRYGSLITVRLALTLDVVTPIAAIASGPPRPSSRWSSSLSGRPPAAATSASPTAWSTSPRPPSARPTPASTGP